MSCDRDDKAMNRLMVRARLKMYKNLQLCFGDNKSKIEAINADMDNAPAFDILMLASDDMIPLVKGFDNIIREKMLEEFPDTDGVLWFNDGYRGNELNTLCILGRAYYERFGYIYHPAYKSLWCDNEFTQVSKALNKQTYIDQVIIKHDHPHVPGSKHKADKLMVENDKADAEDRETFLRRQAVNFDLSPVNGDAPR